MAIKQTFDEVLHRPLTRREFLGQVGTLLLAVIGVSSILHAVVGHRPVANEAVGIGIGNGYGSSAYGG